MEWVNLAPQCDAEPIAGMRCQQGAAWAVHIHSPVEGHGPNDTVWRVLCPAHGVELLRLGAEHDRRTGTPCGAGSVRVMLKPDEWLVDHQDMDLLGWIEWCAQHRKEGLA